MPYVCAQPIAQAVADMDSRFGLFGLISMAPEWILNAGKTVPTEFNP